MTIAWPAGVTYNIVRGSLRLVAPSRAPWRTEMEDGPKRGRRSSTKNIATITFDLSLADDELRTFMLFERDDLVDGTLPFTMSLLVAGGGYETRTVAMTEQYRTARGRDRHTTVSLTLDVLDDYVVPPPEEEDDP
ncbi:MAG: hypothetical protein WDM94_09210 [Bauldia sp.]